MAGRADAARAHIDLARIALGVSDEFRDRLGRKRRIDRHDQRRALDAGDRRDIAREAEIEIGVERGIDRARGSREQQRVAVGGRMRDRGGADIGAGAAAVLDDDLLADALRQRLSDEARNDVEGAAGRNRDDQMHRPRRIGLRAGDTGQRRKRGDAGCQTQKSTAGKLHVFFHQFAFAPENFTTLAHFAVSSATNLPNSPAEPGSTMPPSAVTLAFSAGSASAALISPLSLSMTAAGVFFGAPMPIHWLAS